MSTLQKLIGRIDQSRPAKWPIEWLSIPNVEDVQAAAAELAALQAENERMKAALEEIVELNSRWDYDSNAGSLRIAKKALAGVK